MLVGARAVALILRRRSEVPTKGPNRLRGESPANRPTPEGVQQTVALRLLGIAEVYP